MAIISTGGLSFIGDVTCQYIEQRYSYSRKLGLNRNTQLFKWDMIRSIRFGGIGMTLGPQLSLWYSFLAKRLFIGNSFPMALKRMIVDQSVFAPWVIVFVFTLNTYIDGGNLDDARTRLKEQFLPTYAVNLSVWPMTQLINFWLIPPTHRVLVANFVAAWWNAYVSYRAHIH
eukprot:CAMPEP_0197053632 /NCGR_PEP_ID=MMETSP1384-20130603/27861_1 /TAXON_ID=29189 /ORGANISM="Ammonia sp." /LENGTH=171 /DNA_ID=CAMNT_0042486563 /DNA_START=100 /DNA_END=615 /DNA_ORIENTATION=-